MDDNKIEYFINGERQFTNEKKLTVAMILENAGFKPANQYQLTRDEGEFVYTNYGEEVPLHKGERFTALFLGQTPTS